MNTRPGTRVRIISDCRPGQASTGQVGIYEGDRPRTVNLLFRGKWHEYMYNPFVAGEITFTNGEPVVNSIRREEDIRKPPFVDDTFEKLEAWQNTSGVTFWYVEYNPIIRLPDGSYIWGDECWWEKFETQNQDHTLAEDQEYLEHHKRFLRDIFSAGARHAIPAH